MKKLKKLNLKLLIILFPIIIVLLLAIDFKKNSDQLNTNYTNLLSEIYQFNIHFNEHINIVKESIINLEFNNDIFTNHHKESSDMHENLLFNDKELKKQYLTLFKSFDIYNSELEKIAEDTFDFIRINSQIKNSLTILNMNIEKNLYIYPKDYLKNLIKVTREFVKIKNNLNSTNEMPEVLLNYFKQYDKDSNINKFNYIHIKLLNERLIKFRTLFKEIEDSHILTTINNMKSDLKNDSSKLKDNLVIELYIIIIIAIFSLIIIVVLVNNIQQINKNLERTINIRTKQLSKEKNKAEHAAKSKSEFLANMSHEIRTPLNAILGFIDILKIESKGRKSFEYVNIIDDASKSLLQIIEDILDFSKIESGKLEIDKIDFNSKAEFEVITHLFDAKSLEKNISLEINIDTNIPQVLNTDPLRIKQVISNLLSNAIKFSSEGKKVIVDISYNDYELNVSVKDQGIGIVKDKLDHIFEAFSQEDSSTTRKFGGTGLGLSISSELVKLLGGNLKVKSESGKGSEFYFTIPADIGKEIVKSQKIDKNTDFSSIKILLVEDNKANQMFMKILLKQMNILFDIASDGTEAIEIFQINKYDIVLMDENMPNMNGIEATKNILEYEKQNNLIHTPIIALTANALKGDRERFLNEGMDEYLTKPLDKNKLSKILVKFSENHI